MAERFLADENFPRASVAALRASGVDLAYIGEIAPGIDDTGVADEAVRRDAILLTFDLDFGEMAFRYHVPMPGIVLFRLRQQPPWVVAAFLEAFFASKRTLRGYFTVASPGQVRQRPIFRRVSDNEE